MDKLRESLKMFCGAIGLTYKSVSRDEFIGMMAKFAGAEGNRRRTEDAMLFQLMDAWYDIVDTSDDDMVTLDEYKKILKACRFDARVAENVFKLLDKDNSGKIKRSKLIREIDVHFWFPPKQEGSYWLHLMRLNQFRNDADWVHRMNEVFTLVDADRNECISLKEWELWVDNIQQEVNRGADDELVVELRTSLREFCGAIGLTQDKTVTREEFIDMMARFASAEGDKMQTEEWLLYRLNCAWFNIVDTTDDGMVTLDGYKKIMKACNFGESAAEATFKLLCNETNPGKIERLKLIDMEFKFWFTLGHEESKGMFGDVFELPK